MLLTIKTISLKKENISNAYLIIVNIKKLFYFILF